MSNKGILDRLSFWARRDGEELSRVTREQENAETILAACEYEIGQMWREIALRATERAATIERTADPDFRINERQRVSERLAETA
ncbi:MAG: hypothetical protein NW216_03960 [Hyphomicrobium sp.]|nr:hypothetical protein [Hyphomicrobium sp.]